MNDIFRNSSINSATGEIYIPKGTGPFPTIIIFDTGLKESTKTYATFYAKKMKERGFSVFIVKLNLSKKNEIGSVIEFILKRNREPKTFRYEEGRSCFIQREQLL